MGGVILVGMPGCGKSTVGKLLAQELSLPFYDTDAVFEGAVGQSPAEFLSCHSEAEFRAQEMLCLVWTLQRMPCVVATGGGTVTFGDNIRRMRDAGTVVYLERPLSQLAVNGRPLTAKNGVAALFEKREPLYLQAAHLRVAVQDTPADTVQAILQQLGEEK